MTSQPLSSPNPKELAHLKQQVVQAAIDQLTNEVQMFRDRLREVSEPITDIDDPTDRFDGHGPELRDEVELLNNQLATADADLIRLQQPEFQALYDRVVPGALVHLSNGLKLLVGVNLQAFDTPDGEYRTLTEGAPLFPVLNGKRPGETVDLQGREMQVQVVC